MILEPYTPNTPQSFWCNNCDSVTVDSTRPETGTFHVQHGHQFNQTNREYDGDYVGVMFAVCKPCMVAFKKSLTDSG